MNHVSISIPSVPRPEYDKVYAAKHGGDYTDDRKPLLRVEAYDAETGYGIAGEDMIPGRSITIRADRDSGSYHVLAKRQVREYPILIYVHPQNVGKTHMAWVLSDGSERGGDLSGGKTVNLQDVWADGWIIEGKA